MFFCGYWSKPLYKSYGFKESWINIDLVLYKLVDLKKLLTPITFEYTFLQMLKIVMFFMLPCKWPLFHSFQIFVNAMFLSFLFVSNCTLVLLNLLACMPMISFPYTPMLQILNQCNEIIKIDVYMFKMRFEGLWTYTSLRYKVSKFFLFFLLL